MNLEQESVEKFGVKYYSPKSSATRNLEQKRNYFIRRLERAHLQDDVGIMVQVGQ